MRKIYETAVILIGTLGWWGFVYPELCFTEDVCGQESEAGQLETEEMIQIEEAHAEQDAGGQVRAGQRESGATARRERDYTEPGSGAETGACRTPEGAVAQSPLRMEAGQKEGESGNDSLKNQGAGGLWIGDICIKSRLVEYLYQRGR